MDGMNSRLRTVTLFMLIIALNSCATHSGAGEVQHPYGFFYGILHGIISPFALIANIISWLVGFLGYSIFKSIQIIGRPNIGLWYYTGFILGLLVHGGGVQEERKKRRKKKKY